MSEPNPSNHWDLLASDLGIEPAPEPEQPQGPAAPPAPAKTPRKKETPRPARSSEGSSRPAANWDLLANEFGLPVEPAPQAAEPPPKPRQAEPLRPTGAREPSARREPPPKDIAKDSPNYFDESFDFEEPFDLLDSSEAAAAEPPAEETSSEPQQRKRRRRRRPGRDSERRESRERPVTEADEEPSTEPTGAEEEGDRVAAVGEAEEVEGEVDVEGKAGVESSEGEGRRGRRRRGRRGKKKREVGEPAVEDAAPASEPELEHEEIAGEDLEPSEEGEGEGEGDQPAKIGFRNIPTWEDTIGLLVAKNLDSRTKQRSGGGESRSRGNRGPRDNRGRGGRGDGRRRS